MIYNLCDNAVKYNKDGGSVDITVSGGDNNVTVTVKDTGIESRRHIKTACSSGFFRVDKSRSKSRRRNRTGTFHSKARCKTS